jgi:hypothetical protein
MPSQDQTLTLWVAVCKAHGGGARHWMLMLGKETEEMAIWYHVKGGPTKDRPYEAHIETKRLNSSGIEKRYAVAQIDAKHRNKLKASAQRAPPRFCQRYVVDVLSGLEAKGLVPTGTAEAWARAMEVDPYSSHGARR